MKLERTGDHSNLTRVLTAVAPIAACIEPLTAAMIAAIR